MKLNETNEQFFNIEYIPDRLLVKDEEKPAQFMSYTDVIGIGGQLAKLAPKFADAVKNNVAAGGPGIYEVSFPNGISGSLTQLKDGSAHIGTIMNENKIVGQARLKAFKKTAPATVAIDPVAIAILAIVMDIEHKLDDIQETSQAILAFLEEDKKAQLTGNLHTLSDILRHYKYNWDNEMYIKNQSMIVLDIKKHARQNIEFYRQRISSLLSKKSLPNAQAVNSRAKEIQQQLDQYQTALYNYAFASYIEVLLMENFSSAFIGSVKDSLQSLCSDYRLLYTQCDEKISKKVADTIDNNLLKGLADVNQVAGKAIGKMPFVKKGPVDEALLAVSGKLHEVREQGKQAVSNKIRNTKDVYALAFIDRLDSVDMYFNQPLTVSFDDEDICIAVGS